VSKLTAAQRLAERIRAVRRERVAVVAFITAGFPKKDNFAKDLLEIASETDVVEIGVPFTDPMADGVTIQRSSFEALSQGVTLPWILGQLKQLPEKPKAELVFMGYFNPMLAYGLERLAKDAAEAGICGFIVPDLPIEESAAFEQALGREGLAMIRMVTPVTPARRLEELCRSAQGFVYAVSMTGTTGRNIGSAGSVPKETCDYLDRVRQLAPVPVCAGFGIREAAQVKALAPHVDGVVVGSAIIEAMEKGESTAGLLRRLRGDA
jgi:tryptophan synthase alpha chain